jgi:hypothetical protein
MQFSFLNTKSKTRFNKIEISAPLYLQDIKLQLFKQYQQETFQATESSSLITEENSRQVKLKFIAILISKKKP